MDEIHLAILEKINAVTGLGRYAVISRDEFADALPEGYIGSGELKNALNGLISQGYIDVKYSDGDMYCVAPVKIYEPDLREEKEYAPPPALPAKIKIPNFALTFAAAFLGGLTGSLTVELIALLC